MVKKTVEYNDYNGNKVKEDLYFDLSEAELTEWQYSVGGGLKEHLQRAYDSNDEVEIVKFYKEVLLRSYGEKSPDGKYFVKNEDTKKHLLYSPAYNIVFMEFAQDETGKKLEAFMDGIMPPSLKTINAAKTENNVVPMA